MNELKKLAREIKQIKAELNKLTANEGPWWKNLTPEQIAKALVKHMGRGYKYESHPDRNPVESIAYIESEEVRSFDYGENYLIITKRFKGESLVEAYVENAGGVTHQWHPEDYDDFDKAMKDIARRSKRFL